MQCPSCGQETSAGPSFCEQCGATQDVELKGLPGAHQVFEVNLP